MQWKDVVGQEEVKELLIKQVKEQRVPHALLFTGPEGCGTLPMAVAFANYLLCEHPTDDDSCGTCPACKQLKNYGHPDLHFSFPIIRKSETTTCDQYLSEWTTLIKGGLYFSINDWLNTIEADNKLTLITEAESDNIISQLSISSYEGGYKVMIIWLPERMHDAPANNLLKMLEEPAPKTVFILVAEDTSKMLPTILSRTQRIDFRRLPAETITTALMTRNGLDRGAALQIARISNGSYLNALRFIHIDDESNTYFNHFVALMRMAYTRSVRDLQKWSDDAAGWGREKQKAFFGYSQNMLRENFIYNFQRPELNFMTDKETAFATKFSRFINERNIIGFLNEFSKAQRDIEQNVNARTVFFDFALKVIILLRQ